MVVLIVILSLIVSFILSEYLDVVAYLSICSEDQFILVHIQYLIRLSAQRSGIIRNLNVELVWGDDFFVLLGGVIVKDH
jgi:type III secretory pathway component EscU